MEKLSDDDLNEIMNGRDVPHPYECAEMARELLQLREQLRAARQWLKACNMLYDEWAPIPPAQEVE